MATSPTDGRRTRMRSKRRGIDVADDTSELRARWRIAQERRALAAGTIDARDNGLILLAEHITPRSLLTATAEDIEAFLDGRALGPRARYRYVSNFHQFFEWCVMDGLLDVDPTLRIRRPRSPRVVARPIRDEDLEWALHCADAEMRVLLALGAYAGLRCQEIAGLMVEDLFVDQDPPVLVVTAGKGGHQRVVPLHPKVLSALRRLPMPRDGYVIADELKRARNAGWVSHRVAEFLRYIGVDATAHQLRHWFGTNVYRQSRDLRVTQELLGHSSPNTTTIYVAWSAADAARAVDGLPG